MSEAPERIWTDGFDYSGKPTDTLGRTEYTRADLHTAAMERAYIAGLEAGAQTADLSWQRWKGDDHGLPVVECDVTACDNIAAAIRAIKDPAHVKAAVAKLTEGEG